jgi:hypothetical protein
MPASPRTSRDAAARLAEPRHLDEPARDQRGLAVVAEAEPVDAAGRERDHVLRRGAELDADDVRVDVDAEDERVDRALELARRAPRPRERSRRRGQAARDLLRHVRAGEDGDRAAATSVESRSPVAGSSPSSARAPGASPGSARATSAKRFDGTARTISSASSRPSRDCPGTTPERSTLGR